MRGLKSRLGRLEGRHIRPRRTIREFSDAELEAIVAEAGIDPHDDTALERFTNGAGR